MTPFLDRRDAGCQLAEALRSWQRIHPTVVAIPRGGVPVGYEIARTLGSRLDIMGVRKLGAPDDPELGIGAVAEEGVLVLDDEEVAAFGVGPLALREAVKRERQELERRLLVYRGGTRPVPIDGRAVILADDGLAVGLTAQAAIRALRRRGAREVVLAVPVASRKAVDRVCSEADELLVLQVPEPFAAVSKWYENFSTPSDGEVARLLRLANELARPTHERVTFRAGNVLLHGDLTVPLNAGGMVIFAHGAGSNRLSPFNVQVARALHDAGIATLLFDLLTAEEAGDADEPCLAELGGRLVSATQWVRQRTDTRRLAVGYFGSSSGAAVAAWATSRKESPLAALVSRGGRLDLMGDQLKMLAVPCLLLGGSRDLQILDVNEQALKLLGPTSELHVVPGADHLFEEPGALEMVAGLTVDWFTTHFNRAAQLAA